MKNAIFMAMVFTITIISSAAQPSRQKSADDDAKSSKLWKISKTGEKDSYLYAICHSANASTTKINPEIPAILDKVESLAMELKMDEPGLQEEMMKYLGMNDNQKLSAIYTAKQFSEVDSFFVSILGASLSNFETFKPLALQSYILPSFLGYELFSFETSLILAASEKGKNLLGLETVEKQLSAFDKLDYSIQAELLYKMVKKDETLRKSYVALNQAYDSGNMEEIYTISKGLLGKPGSKAIFDDRNISFTKQIIELTGKQPILIALGAGHFGGKNGILKLLAQKGFSVLPLN